MQQQKPQAPPADVQVHLARMEALLKQRPELAESGYVSLDRLDEQGRAELASPTRGRNVKLVRGNPALKQIALTIDDGPHPVYTQKLLDVLRRERVRATFFVVGKFVDAHPELVQMEAQEGHEIASHTYSHLRLPLLGSDALIREELRLGHDAIRRAVPGHPSPDFFRPPGGEYNDTVLRYAENFRYTNVLWTDNPGDYRPGLTAAELTRLLLRDANPGGIILIHSGVDITIQVLPGVLRELKRRGYTFVTCSEMARDPKAVVRGGPNTNPALKRKP